MSARYYQDELRYLREMGREFAQQHPEVAPLLLEAGSDPSVERLLEGFAFLTARIREKLDDELPEFTIALLEAMLPHLLRPVPSLTILQLQPLAKAFNEITRVPRGAVVDSLPVDGTRCRFTTTAPLEVVPLKVESVALRNEAPPRLIVRLGLLQGTSVARLGLTRLRLHLGGDEMVARQLLACFGAYLKELRVEVESANGERRSLTLPPGSLRVAGFAADEAVLADEASGYRGFNVLHEYFAFPEKFLFVEIRGLDRVPLLAGAAHFSLVVVLDRLPEGMPTPTPEHLLLNCVPAVNRFAHDADPIRVDHEAVEYRIRPEGRERTHFDIYDVTSVTGVGAAGEQERVFQPLFHYAARMGLTQDFYAVRPHPALGGRLTDHFVSLVQVAGAAATPLTLSLRLRCTNATLPEALGPGDIATHGEGIPAGLKVRNLTKPSAPIPAPLGDDLHWRLLGHLNVNLSSLAGVEALRGLLATYNFAARHNRKELQAFSRLLDGIRSVVTRREKRLFDGAMITGVAVEVGLDEDHFASTGDLYLFGCVLDELFSQFVSLNAFKRLTVRGTRYGEIFAWPARIGHRQLL
jgi:type VI secretion system protein ImpG